MAPPFNFHQIVLDKDHKVAKDNDGYFVHVTLYRLAMSLKELDGQPFGPKVTKESVKEEGATSYVSERAALFNNMPAFKVSALLDVFNYFEQKVAQLTRVVKDPTFWKAAA